MGQRSIFQLVNSDVNSTGQLLSPTREENNKRFVEMCFLTCHEPPRCFILPISTRDKRRNSTSRSSHILSFSLFSCTASGQVQLDLVLDAVQQRWVEAVVAQVHRLHSRCGIGCYIERNDEKNKNKTKEKDGSNLLQDLCKINNHQHHSRELRIHQH